jgi:membrane protease YdiL (CAAX protease family)
MTSQATLLRRYLECAAFILGWMACEHYFHLSPLQGQLLGIPLIALFQLFVARRPLQQLWAFDAEKFRVNGKTLAIAGVFAAACGALLWLGTGRDVVPSGGRLTFFAFIVAAATPTAFAVGQQRAAACRRALPWLLAAALLRVGWYAAWHEGAMLVPVAKLPDFATTWLCEFVAFFLVDEVAFRGALDPHLSGGGTGRLHAWCSAIFVSILWAIWHLPAYNPHARSFLALFSGLGPFHVSIMMMGVLLSFCARRARTLVPSSIMHAFGNAHVLALTAIKP